MPKYLPLLLLLTGCVTDPVETSAPPVKHVQVCYVEIDLIPWTKTEKGAKCPNGETAGTRAFTWEQDPGECSFEAMYPGSKINPVYGCFQ